MSQLRRAVVNSARVCSIGCVIIIGSILSGLAGCQTGPTIPEAVPISGNVVYNGEPVAGASVTFVSNDPKGKTGAGSTDALGGFRISTYFDPTHILDGVAAGDYRVTVTVVPRPLNNMGSQPEQSEPAESPIPIKYSNPETSELKVTAIKGMAPLVLELKD